MVSWESIGKNKGFYCNNAADHGTVISTIVFNHGFEKYFGSKPGSSIAPKTVSPLDKGSLPFALSSAIHHHVEVKCLEE